MIKSLLIKNTASFDSTGVQLDDLKHINFVYGSNGSGKTTISNFINDPSNSKYDDCSIKWDADIPIEALVYNKGFRERNFGNDDIPGVFTLGEATKEEIDLIKEKEKELGEIKAKGKQKRTSKELTEKTRNTEISDFKEIAWTRFFKKHEAIFKEAFTNHYGSKQKFYEKLLSEFENNESDLEEYDNLKKKAKTIFGKPPTELTKLLLFEFTRIREIEADTIWNKKIVGKADVDIATLIQRLNINDWVNEGRGYIKADSRTCPFCQEETISDKLKTDLEKYFDETYINDLKKVKSLTEEYQSITSSLINQLDEIERTQKDVEPSHLELDLFSANLKTLKSRIQTNNERQTSKSKEPSRSFDLTREPNDYQNILEMLEKANVGIEAHNLIVANFKTEKDQLIGQVWQYLIDDGNTEIDTHVKKIAGLQKAIDKIDADLTQALKEHAELKQEIAELNKAVTSVKPAVDEINRTLISYGFSNFSIEPSEEHDNRYQIKRENGELAESTLSEGEITFITFLYFLQRTKGGLTEETVSNERVLVIDDPISSLDSNVLFVVSSLIKEIIKQIKDGTSSVKQIIVLTHNVYFHKEVSFIDGRTKRIGNTNYWILRKRNKISSVQFFGQDNPISTSYELLWKELIEREHNSGVAIQNIMRRIVENYFKILGKYGDDKLILKFETREDQEVCRSLICWINDGSHSIAEDLYVEVPADTIERYFEVFEKIFINTGHEGHYKMMMRIEDGEPEQVEA